MCANWVGYAGSFAPYGEAQWRVPLALQLPWGIVLFFNLCTFMPKSPRELIRKNRVQDARQAFSKIRPDLHSHEAAEEFEFMKAQIQYEMTRQITSYTEIFKLYRHRVLVSVSIQVMTSITGINVIQYYQTTLYKSLGIDRKTVLALAAAWGTCAFISNAIANNFLPDRLGRRRMLLAGLCCVIVTETYCAVLQRVFQNTDNRVGKGFAILGIYMFSVCYYSLINSVTWLYGAEVLPMSIRSKIMGVAAAAHYIVNVGVIIYFYYPETKQKTLEEIAAEFGDKVVEVDEREIVAREVAFDAEKASESKSDEHKVAQS
ncbi:hypothetical protein MGN70_013129 [Eutypa lata]|nr:hypothetical protein MGN70_013129 [Eutypa lata]